MTPFWKDERWGYNMYQKEQNLFFGWTSPILLMVWETVNTNISNCIVKRSSYTIRGAFHSSWWLQWFNLFYSISANKVFCWQWRIGKVTILIWQFDRFWTGYWYYLQNTSWYSRERNKRGMEICAKSIKWGVVPYKGGVDFRNLRFLISLTEVILRFYKWL